MRAKALAVLALGLAACGSDSASDGARDASASDASNRPPRIVAIAIEPDEPTPDDRIAVSLEAVDPEHGPLSIDLEWFVNGASIASGEATEFPEDIELTRGDEVFVVVRADDGVHQVARESDRVTVRNRPPRVTSLRLLPEDPTSSDNLLAVVEAIDPEGDALEFVHRWWRNGALIEDQHGPALASGLFRRRDELRVEVAASDGFGQGSWVSSALRTIANTPPRILSKPNYEMSAPDLYEYVVEADDQDGDAPLRFELVQAPKGMRVDVVNGRVQWRVPPGARGVQTVEISVSDPHGGQARQRYALDIRWEDRPAQPASKAERMSDDPADAPGATSRGR